MRLEILKNTKTIKTPIIERFIEITPDIASELLKHNYSKNRKKRTGVITSYANDMGNDNWTQFHPAPIVIGHDGKLYDGQHRLEGVIKSGVPQIMNVIENADPSVYITIDNGLSRRASDFLDMPYAPNIAVISGILYCLTKAENNSLSNVLEARISRNVSCTRSDRITTAKNNEELLTKYVMDARQIAKRLDGSFVNHVATALMFIEQLTQTSHYTEFKNELESLTPNSAAVARCRERIKSFKQDQQINSGITGNDQRLYNVGLILTAYELFKNNKDNKSEKYINKELNDYKNTISMYNDLLQTRRENHWH